MVHKEPDTVGRGDPFPYNDGLSRLSQALRGFSYCFTEKEAKRMDQAMEVAFQICQNSDERVDIYAIGMHEQGRY